LTEPQLEYWVKKGFSEEGAKLKQIDRQTTFSKEICIEKHGEVKGLKIFNDRQKKWSKSLHENFEREGDSRSKGSQCANELIKNICKELNIEVPKKEKWISNGIINRSFDFTYGKKMIEFNGDYWHCNPSHKKFGVPTYYHKINKSMAVDVWAHDKEKIQLAESYGYEVLVIWESEYNENKEKTLQRCVEFLK